MNFAMATRKPKGPVGKPGETCTEFQLHKSQNSNTCVKGVIDYTEKRLEKYIEQIDDAQQRQTLTNILEKYKSGRVGIAWKAGRPVWLNVTLDKSV